MVQVVICQKNDSHENMEKSVSMQLPCIDVRAFVGIITTNIGCLSCTRVTRQLCCTQRWVLRMINW